MMMIYGAVPYKKEKEIPRIVKQIKKEYGKDVRITVNSSLVCYTARMCRTEDIYFQRDNMTA